MSEKRLFKIKRKPELQSSSLVVGWDEDAGQLGPRVIHYLREKLGCEEFGEIEPGNFFSLAGVAVEDDVAQFPESKFYCCEEESLVIFSSSVPRSEWYKFLNLILDVAEHYCHIKELYTIGGMVSFSAHTAPREALAVANSTEMKQALSQYELAPGFDYQTPPGQRPTLSSFLLWTAGRRNIAGASLWVPVPFYLVAIEDPPAWKKPLEFFDQRFALGIDFADLDAEIERGNEKIAQARSRFPEIDNYIGTLENNQGLTEQESEKLIRGIQEFLRKGD